MKIAFITLGCKLNYAETSTYERGLLKEGFEAVREKAHANAEHYLTYKAWYE